MAVDVEAAALLSRQAALSLGASSEEERNKALRLFKSELLKHQVEQAKRTKEFT